MRDIAYISADFLPLNTAAAVRASFFVDKIISEGDDVVVFTSTKNSNYKIVKNLMIMPSNKDHNIKRLLKEFFYGIELFFRILFFKKMDLYIISTPPFFISAFAFMAAKIKNKNSIILDVRDIYPEVFFENKLIGRESLVGKILRKIEFFMYNNSENIFTVTNGLKDLIVSTGIDKSKVQLIRNGYDSNLFKINENKYDDFTIVFHGTLSKFQNIEVLLELIEKFNKLDTTIKFVIIGNGSKDYLVRDKKLENLIYLDNINYNQISTYISKCHLGLSLRTDDKIGKTAFPVKIFEYIGVGIPVISTPYSEAAKVISNENIGIESNNNIDEIVQHIYNIKNNYKTFSDNILKKRNSYSRQFVVENFYKYL